MNAPAPTTAGPTGFHGLVSRDQETFKPEAKRYILYVSYACSWASRCLIVRKLKKLDDIVPIVQLDLESVTDGDDAPGWQFNQNLNPDPVMNAKSLRDIYLACCPNYAGRCSIPVLYDTKTRTIVNNESSEIIKILNSAFDDLLPGRKIDLFPPGLPHDIYTNLIPLIADKINLGVYKAVKAKTQVDYESHCLGVFQALDKAEEILGKNRFLAGNVFTEADVRLFTSAIRFPILYECLFKCNLKSLRDGQDYPNIFNWMKMIYQIPEVAATVKIDEIKYHYYKTMKTVNPSGFVPLYNGPDLTQPKLPTSELDFAWTQ